MSYWTKDAMRQYDLMGTIVRNAASLYTFWLDMHTKRSGMVQPSKVFI